MLYNSISAALKLKIKKIKICNRIYYIYRARDEQDINNKIKIFTFLYTLVVNKCTVNTIIVKERRNSSRSTLRKENIIPNLTEWKWTPMVQWFRLRTAKTARKFESCYFRSYKVFFSSIKEMTEWYLYS